MPGIIIDIKDGDHPGYPRPWWKESATQLVSWWRILWLEAD